MSEIKRYYRYERGFDSRIHDYHDTGGMDTADDGEWVRFADHQQALAAANKRIAELEAENNRLKQRRTCGDCARFGHLCNWDSLRDRDRLPTDQVCEDFAPKEEIQPVADRDNPIADLEAKLAKYRRACEMALEYLPAKDGCRTLEPGGDVQLMICKELRDALAESEGGNQE